MESRLVVLGDIGGTNARFQVVNFSLDAKEPTVVRFENYSPNSFPTLEACLKELLKEYVDTPRYPQFACIGVAGPVIDNTVKMANVIWPKFDGNELSKCLNIPHFVLLNDFEAIGFAMMEIDLTKDVIAINKAEGRKFAPIGVIGPGTGLGSCLLYASLYKPSGEVRYNVIPCEGGHITAYAYDQLEFDFIQYMRVNYPFDGLVDFEHIMCGPAITKMYDFFKGRQGVEKTKIEEDLQSPPKSQDILTYGMENKCSVCKDVVDLLLKLNGREVGNLALRTLNYGGVFVVGNIMNHLAKYIVENPDNAFTKAYLERNPLIQEILKKIPVFIVTKPELGLFGAFVEAKRLAKDLTFE
eukprot:TRINITY_DN9167_c0_g1_i2.p1 TRINITY_DN9167_c0_g1~~TRINITY_DN9167_c0_g1_i2.p1  ORF type:complete len:355 (+),score=97.91 TRINITY_DN9167_c0_g1_i2:149-1213(+)